jgi:hypothetical protein
MKMIEIKSRPGVFFKLDDEVAEKIGHLRWYKEKRGYIYGNIQGRRTYIHRAVIWATTGEWPPAGMDVDHINHDRLDNQASNLRVVPKSLNSRNMTGERRRISKYKGVRFNRPDKTWVAHVGVRIDGVDKRIMGSNTKDEAEAARCYDCITHWIGGFMLPNFPDESFDEKWERIGERQRGRIIKNLAKNGLWRGQV